MKDYFDLGFGRRNFMGMDVITPPDRPRYTLPADVPPPPGMTRAEFDAWSREICGVVSPIPAGTVYMLQNMFVMRPKDAAMLINCTA